MLTNHELMDTILSYCDGGSIHVCCMYNPPVSHEADVLIRAADVCFRLGSMEMKIITGKVSVGYLLGRALNVSV